MIGEGIDYPILCKILSKQFLDRKGTRRDLADRLKQCYQLLSKIPQKDDWDEEPDDVRELLETKLPAVCQAVIQAHCLKAKDKSVKLYTACCLVDLLRIFAPESPYTSDVIRDIFILIEEQIPLTGFAISREDLGNAKFLAYFHILESLAFVQSHLCLLELPEEMSKFIETVCSVVREGSIPIVRQHCHTILDCIIEESDVISYSFQSILYNRLVSPIREQAPAQRDLVGSLLLQRVKEFQPLIKDFIQETFSDSSEKNYKIREENRYDLIRSLIDLQPDLLIDAIPLLRLKLEDEDAKTRQQQVLFWSSVFKAKRAKQSDESVDSQSWAYCIPQSLQCLYVSLLQRFTDISPKIRSLLCEDATTFVQQPFFQEKLVEKLSVRCQDSEARVRLKAVRSLCVIAKEYPHLITEAIWRRLLERTMDKKESVRFETFVQAAKVFKDVIHPYWKNGEEPPNERKVFSLTPEILFKSLFVLGAEEKKYEFGYFLLERVVVSDLLLGGDLSVKQRTRIFVKSVQDSSSKQNTIFLRKYIDKKRKTQQALAAVLAKRKELIDTPNDSKLEQDLLVLKRFLARIMPDVGGNEKVSKGSKFIHDLFNELDRNVFSLLGTLSNPQTTLADFVAAREKLIAGVRARNKTKRKLTAKPLVKQCCTRVQDMMQQVNYVEYVDLIATRTAFWLFPVDSVPHLLTAMNIVEEPGGRDRAGELKYRRAASCVLSSLAESLPEIFDSQKILNVISSSLQKNSYSNRSQTCLFALLPNACRSTKAPRGLKDYLKRVIHSDGGPNQVCQSLHAYLLLQGGKDPTKEIYRMISELRNQDYLTDLSRQKALDIETRLTCLKMVGKQFPEMLEQPLNLDGTGDQIAQEFVWLLLDRVEVQSESGKDTELNNWCPLLTKAKLEGIQGIVQWLLSRSRVHNSKQLSEEEIEQERAALSEKALPVFKKLLSIVYHGGRTGKKFERQSSQDEADKIMLTSALAILDLCSSPIFTSLLKPSSFQMMAKVATAGNPAVKKKFLKSILNRVLRRKLHNQWTVILSLVANDPDKQFRQFVEHGIRRHVKTTRQMISCCGNIKAEVYPEYILAYQIHLLAHHPDEKPQETQMENELKFILNCILKSPNPNMALTWKILEKIKRAEDGQKGNRQTERLHKYADLAGKLIKVNFKGHRESKFSQPFSLPSDNYEVGRDERCLPQGGRSASSSNKRIVSRFQGGKHINALSQSMFTVSPITRLKRPRSTKEKRTNSRKPLLKPPKGKPLQPLSPLNFRPSKRAKFSTPESQSIQNTGRSSQSSLQKLSTPDQEIQSENNQNILVMESPINTCINLVTESSPELGQSTGSRRETASSHSPKVTGLDNSSQSSLF